VFWLIFFIIAVFGFGLWLLGLFYGIYTVRTDRFGDSTVYNSTATKILWTLSTALFFLDIALVLAQFALA